MNTFDMIFQDLENQKRVPEEETDDEEDDDDEENETKFQNYKC